MARAALHPTPHTAQPRSQVSRAPCSSLVRPLSPAELSHQDHECPPSQDVAHTHRSSVRKHIRSHRPAVVTGTRRQGHRQPQTQPYFQAQSGHGHEHGYPCTKTSVGLSPYTVVKACAHMHTHTHTTLTCPVMITVMQCHKQTQVLTFTWA